MKKLKLFSFVTMALLALTGTVNANTDLLVADDLVGISFWVISMGMLAATAFFFLERGSVASNWRTTLTVAGIVTGVTLIYYLYVRNIYIGQGEALILYRYVDWIITMPLQMIQFYLILATVRKVAKSGNKPMVSAYVSMRMIVTVGWAIYPLGYIFGYITNSLDNNLLNIIYNIADFINKIAFGLVIWVAAMQNTAPRIR